MPAGGLVRLLPDGKVDPDFKSGEGARGAMAEVKAIELLENGKILVAGSFTSFGGKEAKGIAMMHAERTLMFSSDYPHWDNDSPHRAFPKKLPDDLKQRIFWKNAAELYRLKRD